MVLLSVGSSVSLSLWLVVVMVLTGTAPFCCLARAQPVNDNCTDAISFIPKTDTTDLVTGSTIGGNVGPLFHSCSQPDKENVFYSFEGKGTRITLSTCSASTNFPTAIILAQGCGAYDCLAVSDGDLKCTTTANAAAITFNSEMSKTYTVVIYGRQPGFEGNFGLNALTYIPPPNDLCNDAIPFRPVVTKGTILTGSTVNATVGPLFHSCSQPDKENVFYSFEGTGTRITLSTCSASTNFPTAIILAQGCGAYDCLAVSDGDLACTTTANAAAITFDAEMSKTYTVVIYGRQPGLEGNFGLTALEYIPPPNILCTNAISVQPGSRTVGYTVNATVGPSLNVQPNTNVCPTVWYSVLGNGNLFKATTCSDMTDYNTAITVSSGCGSGLVSSNIDDSCSVNGGASAVSWNTTAGTRYNIAVHGRAKGDEGNFELIVMDMNNPVALGPVPRPTSTLPPPTTPPPMGLPTKVPASLTKAPITPRPLGQATTASPSKARVVVVAPTLSAAPLSAAPLPSAPMPFLAPATPVVQSLSGPNTPVESPVIAPTRMRAPFPTVRIPYPIPCYPEIPKPLCYPTTAPGTQALPERNFLAASDAIHWSWLWGALLPAMVGWIM